MLGVMLLNSLGANGAPGPEVTTQPVGLIQIPINSGANFISTPLHRIHTFRGVVASVTADSFSFTANPGWTANQFSPEDNRIQFIALVRKSGSAGLTHEGDWWPVLGNDANSLVLDNRSEDLGASLVAGDHVELRGLTSLQDLFGSGANLTLNKDSNGFASVAEEDIIRFLTGTGFSSEVFYHDGTLAPEGFYVNGDGPFDGSTLTLWPDQAFMVFRKSGSPPLSVKVVGQVQTTRLTHYLEPAANALGTGFAVAAAVGASQLLESGWLSDANGFRSTAEEDLIRTVVGTGFEKEIFHHDGSLADAGWYVNGLPDNDFALQPGKGYFIFLKGPGGMRWPQPVP
jgi:uncharacterized protein (TIGR02597 family)